MSHIFKILQYRCIRCFRGLEFDKNVPRLVITGAMNLKKKQSKGNTLLRYEYLFYLNTQVQVLKSFDSLLIQTFTVSTHGTSCQNFFSSPMYVRDFFFGTIVLCSNFFLTLMHIACRIFVFKITHPPTPLK